jgi:hypothetical protein
MVIKKKRLMELITASHSRQMENEFPHMNRTAHRETYAVKRSTKLITSFNSKYYRPSGILIHQQNSYPPRRRRRAGRREAQSREPVDRGKNLLYIVTDLINALPGNSPVNTVQHATIEKAVFSVSAVTSQQQVVIT